MPIITITHLVTHNGSFHTDELLSSVILTRLYPQAEVVRTRDAAWIAPGEGKIIYDVGCDYDAKAGIFDHHQRPNSVREDDQLSLRRKFLPNRASLSRNRPKVCPAGPDGGL